MTLLNDHDNFAAAEICPNGYQFYHVSQKHSRGGGVGVLLKKRIQVKKHARNKFKYMLIKYTCHSKSQTLRMRYSFQSTGRPIFHRNGWTFRVYMIALRNLVPE